MRRETPARGSHQKPPVSATLPEFIQAADVARPLARISCLVLFYVVLLLAALFADRPLAGVAAWALLKAEFLRGGTVGLVLATLLTALAGIATTRLIVQARVATLAPAPLLREASSLPRWRRPLAWAGRRLAPRRRTHLPPISRWAAWPQTVPLLALLALAALMLWRFGTVAGMPAADARSCMMLGAVCCALAFPLLVAERHVAAIEPARLPEAPGLKALLFLPIMMLLITGLIEIGEGLGLAWVDWARPVLGFYLALVMAELALRTLGVFFQPPPQPHEARGAIDSLAAKAIRPATVSPKALSASIRDRFGIDFSRSWALVFVRQAAMPVCFVMLVFCWCLTGVTDIGLSQRGVYERFGAPVAVLKPGLHIAMPWPFGRVRRVDYGVLRDVAVGREQAAAPIDATSAEAIPPASANRLWDDIQGTDVDYLIASRIGEAGGPQKERQSFEAVSANLDVIYRVGMDDASARRALYGVADPQGLVGETAGRLLSRFFASQTLNGVLGEDRQAIARALQVREQAELDRLHSGIEVVAMVVGTMHPPAGAAQAYRNVQAAEIVADTSIAEERGRAQSTLNVARQNARNLTNQAQGNAADTMGAAQVALTDFEADEAGYRIGGKDFLNERYLADLKAGLSGAAIEIVDDRLQQPDMPLIDLRPPGAASSTPMEGGAP